MAASDEDNEVDGDGATVDGATGDYGDDDDYGDGRWTTTTMATARRATGYDDNGEDDGGGRRRQRGWLELCIREWGIFLFHGMR